MGDGGIQTTSAINYLTIKPSEVWNLVKKLALARYKYQFPESVETLQGFSLPFYKLSTIRDLCLSIGLII